MCAARGKADDDEPIPPERQETKTDTPEGSTNPQENPKGPEAAATVPEATTALDVTTIPVVGNPEDLGADLVKITQKKLHLARAASLNRLRIVTPEGLAATMPPDREIALEILRAFADGDDGVADFEAWLKSTVDRELGRKAKGSRWGLYLADARIEANNLPIMREAAAKPEASMDISRARRQAEKAAEEAAAAVEADRPMAALEAYVRIRAGIQGRGVPRPLKGRLERTGELISPNALEAAIRGWKRCPSCQECGLLGTAIDRDLRFCACPAGIEESYRKGADWPAEEIARVHGSAKSILVAACCAIGLQFAADVITDAEVTDNGETLQVYASDRYFRTTEGDVCAAVARLGWQRRILITGGLDAKRQPVAAPTAKQEAARPARSAITQADVDAEVAKRRQKRYRRKWRPEATLPPGWRLEASDDGHPGFKHPRIASSYSPGRNRSCAVLLMRDDLTRLAASIDSMTSPTPRRPHRTNSIAFPEGQAGRTLCANKAA